MKHFPVSSIWTLSKPGRQRQRQRERHQTKDLMSSAMAVDVRYRSIYICQPPSPKQLRKMTKFWLSVAERERRRLIFSYFRLELIVGVTYLV